MHKFEAFSLITLEPWRLLVKDKKANGLRHATEWFLMLHFADKNVFGSGNPPTPPL